MENNIERYNNGGMNPDRDRIEQERMEQNNNGGMDNRRGMARRTTRNTRMSANSGNSSMMKRTYSTMGGSSMDNGSANPSDIENVYMLLSKRMCEAVMFHCQLIDYFAFLGLQGFKRMAEYQYMSECADKTKLHKRYIDIHHRVIPETNPEEFSIIPDEWQKTNVTTKSVKDSDVSKYVKMALDEWCNWEEETKRIVESCCDMFAEYGAYSDKEYCGELLADVEKEIKKVNRLYEQMNGTGYDATSIHDAQDKYHRKYKKKYQEHFTAKAMKRGVPDDWDEDRETYRKRRIGF